MNLKGLEGLRGPIITAMEGSNEILFKYRKINIQKDQYSKTGTEGDNSIRCGRTYMKPCKFKSQAIGNRCGG